MANNIRLSVEEKDLILSMLLNAQEGLSMEDSMEYGVIITDIIEKLRE